MGFLFFFEDIETRTLGSFFFYRRFLEKKNFKTKSGNTWSPKYHVFIFFEGWAGGVSNILFFTTSIWRRKLDAH